MGKNLKGTLILLLAALIWGGSNVAQKSGSEVMGPFAFIAVRTLLGGLVLIPVIIFLDRRRRNSIEGIEEREKIFKASEDARGAIERKRAEDRKVLFKGGICCGIALFAAASIQQIGIFYTTAGKMGFITSLYVIFVPVTGIFMRRRVGWLTWLCVAGAAVGMYFLCIPATGGFGGVNKGDVIVFACSICYTAHILIIDHFSPKVDGVKMSCIQFFTAGILASVLLPVMDPLLGYGLPSADSLMAGAIPLLYSGVMACGVAYTIQIIGQKYIEPALASIVLCSESVFSVLAGMVVLGESMNGREIAGCLVMFLAIVASQVPVDKLAVSSK